MPMRWRVALLVSAAIAISYLDRQALPVAVKAIEADIPLTNTQFGELTSSFLLAYALMYTGGGVIVDRLGTRRGLLTIMIFWSLACASHSLAGGFGLLVVSRFLLGMGEGGGFPAATKVIAEWFPVASARPPWDSSTREPQSAPSSRRRPSRRSCCTQAGAGCSSPAARPVSCGRRGGRSRSRRLSALSPPRPDPACSGRAC